jgi:hypothetical protein
MKPVWTLLRLAALSRDDLAVIRCRQPFPDGARTQATLSGLLHRPVTSEVSVWGLLPGRA